MQNSQDRSRNFFAIGISVKRPEPGRYDLYRFPPSLAARISWWRYSPSASSMRRKRHERTAHMTARKTALRRQASIADAAKLTAAARFNGRASTAILQSWTERGLRANPMPAARDRPIMTTASPLRRFCCCSDEFSVTRLFLGVSRSTPSFLFEYGPEGPKWQAVPEVFGTMAQKKCRPPTVHRVHLEADLQGRGGIPI